MWNSLPDQKNIYVQCTISIDDVDCGNRMCHSPVIFSGFPVSGLIDGLKHWLKVNIVGDAMYSNVGYVVY